MMLVFLFLIGYFIGNINPAIVIAKRLRGIDIRAHNSKNAGTSNVTMTIGWSWGMTVLLIDIAKGLVPALVVRILFPDINLYWFVIGFGSIIGHIYPVFYGFQGGKGSATYGGVLFAVMPIYAAIMFVMYVLILLVFDYIVLSTVFVIVLTPIVTYFMGFHWGSVLIMTLFMALSLYKHRENLHRLWKKEEVGIRKFHRNKDKIRVK